MAEETTNLVLVLLREMRSDMATGFKRVYDELDDLKYRVSSVEQQVASLKTEISHLHGEVAHLRADLAHYSARQDEQDRQLKRIERRLELRNSE